jgi:hypothetical protein
MPADIVKAIYFRVEGVAGETKGLSWSILDKMGNHLQKLISLLAKYNLENISSPQLDNAENYCFFYAFKYSLNFVKCFIFGISKN